MTRANHLALTPSDVTPSSVALLSMFKFAPVACIGHGLCVLPSTTRLCHRRREAARARRWAIGHVVQWNLGAIYLRLSTWRQVLDQPHLKRLVRDTACPGKGLWDVDKGTGALGHHDLSKPSFLAL